MPPTTNGKNMTDMDTLAGMAADDKDPKMPTAAQKKATAAKKTAAPRKRKGRGSKVDIAKKVEETMSMAGAGMLAVATARESPHLMYDAQVIIGNAEETGKALAALADEDPKIKAALERAFTTSSWAKVAMVFMSTAVPIAACHGLAPHAVGQMVGPKNLAMPAPPVAKAKKPTPPKRPTMPTAEQAVNAEAAAREEFLARTSSDIPSAASGLPDAT